jgi:aryl-alcohol dehydrogenase-like predicted oxidoreductase
MLPRLPEPPDLLQADRQRRQALVRDAEKTIIPALRDHKMRLLPYFPPASGLLSGKYRGGAIRQLKG